jgi:hypothetical protein
MNAQSPIIATGEDESWERITNLTNAWRGAVLYHFSKAEHAITETLFVLAAVPDTTPKVRLRHLCGHRLEDLLSAIGPGGPFETDGRDAHSALVSLQELEKDRAFIVHGRAETYRRSDGKWLLLFNLLTIRRRKEERQQKAFAQKEALKLLERIKSVQRELCNQLNRLRQRVETKGARAKAA